MVPACTLNCADDYTLVKSGKCLHTNFRQGNFKQVMLDKNSFYTWNFFIFMVYIYLYQESDSFMCHYLFEIKSYLHISARTYE